MTRYTFSIPATRKNGTPTKLYPKRFYPGTAEWIEWTDDINKAMTWPDKDTMCLLAEEFVDPDIVELEEKNEQDSKLDVQKASRNSKPRTTLFD